MRVLDSNGRVVEVVEPDATGKPVFTSDVSYDSFGKVVSIRQHGAKGDAIRERTFAYNGNHQVISSTSPESGTTTYTYDGTGKVSSKTDARGVTVTYDRDMQGRVISKRYTDGTPGHNYSFQSDGLFTASFLDVPAGHDAERSYSYDEKGRLESLTAHMPGASGQGYSVRVQHDLAGNLASITYPDGRVLSQTWTDRGSLKSIRDGNRLLYAANLSETSSRTAR